MLDKARHEHVEVIDGSGHAFEIRLGGTLDGFNTVAYPPTYAACMRQESKFEPTRYVVIENIGDVDVVHPWLVVNGRRDWYSVETVLASLLRDGMSDEAKATAIWSFLAGHDVQAHDNNRRVGPPFPAEGNEHNSAETSNPSANTFQERANPIKAINSYYCSGCSLSAANLVILARHAGLTARAVWMSSLEHYRNHCLGEVWYDGAWHLFDPERRAFFLAGDNMTLCSYQDLHEEPALEERTHNGGFASKGMRPHAPEYERYWPQHNMPVEDWVSTMAITLRPGEKLIRRWAHDGKYRYGHNPRKKGHLVPYQLAGGKLIYEPPLTGEAYHRGIVGDLNLTRLQEGDRVRLHPMVTTGPDDKKGTLSATPGWVIYKVTSPWPIVGGLLTTTFGRATAEDACRVYLSAAQGRWKPVWSTEGTGTVDAVIDLDAALDARPRPAIYVYYVKLELLARDRPNDAWLSNVRIETDLQMAMTSLPALSVGENRIVYRSDSGRRAKARVTFGWEESTATRPPYAPTGPTFPQDKARLTPAELTRLAWEPAVDPDGEGIKTYHVQVSPWRDFRRPVSPNLDRLTSSGKPEWPMPKGWFVTNRTYTWRVRAQDPWGAWSDWSPAWVFTVDD